MPAWNQNDLRSAVDVFVPSATPASAVVIVELAGWAQAEGYSVQGRVIGPECQYSSTLQARIPFVRGESSAAHAWQAAIPDPCFWTPSMPFLYRVEIELTKAGGEPLAVQQPLGIRPLAVRGRSFHLEGKAWRLRAARRESVPGDNLRDWHDADLAMEITDPDAALCQAASQAGVLLVACISPGASVTGWLKLWSRFPAVGIAVLPPSLEPADELRRQARGILLAMRAGEELEHSLSPCQTLLCDLEVVTIAQQTAAALGIPLIVHGPGDVFTNPAEARAACDRLQRRLAPQGDIAGYIVG